MLARLKSPQRFATFNDVQLSNLISHDREIPRISSTAPSALADAMRIDVAPLPRRPTDEVAWLVAQETTTSSAGAPHARILRGSKPLYARILDESTRLIASG
jgi:hypothetical protein